jgi:hypothetical protein
MTAVRIKAAEIAPTRLNLLAAQKGKCDLCCLACSTEDAVLDHDHTTGAIRSTLHRSCNALLGKVENNAKRYGVKNLAAWAAGVPRYLQKHYVNRTGLLHPTHKTDDEKRVRRNTLARKRRATKGAA